MGDDRTLICFVEAWSEQGDPTETALLAQARSMVRLGLYDRAWGRLQSMQGSSDPEIAILTGQMFMSRGWHNKARKLLETALKAFPENRILSDLYDQASEPATEPDHSEVDPTDRTSSIAAARHHMASGALLRARAILDRVQRNQSEEDLLVSDLLWAIDGDFSLKGETLPVLAHRHGTGLQSLPDLPEDPDHTETADVDDILPPDEVGAFPTLFRNLEPQTEYYPVGQGDEEVTHVSAMASLRDMGSEPEPTKDTDPGELIPPSEVTQIQMVVRKDGAMEEDTSTEPKSSIFDLATLPPIPTSDFDMGPEQEDADVVIHTRVSEEPDDTDAVTQVGAVPLDIEVPPENLRQTEDEAASWVKPPPVPERPVEPAKPAPTPPPAKKRTRVKPTRWPLHVAALGGVLLIAIVLIIGAVILSLAASWL